MCICAFVSKWRMTEKKKITRSRIPQPAIATKIIYILYIYKERVRSQPNCAAADMNTDMAKKLSLFAASLPPTNCPCPINYAKSLRLSVAPRQPLTLLLPCPPSVCQCPHTVIDSSTWTLDCTGCFSCYRLWQIPNTYIYHPVECHF